MPRTITIRVYEELNDFLHYSRRKKPFSLTFSGKRTIKDILESAGIPHTEIDLILANGASVTFDYHPANEDYISVYPVFESFDIHELTTLRPAPLRATRFILDVHLGTLARYLRMAGFNSLYRNDLEDEEIIRISLGENRIILTRDLPILKNGRVTHGYFIRETSPQKQLREVIRRFDLKDQVKPFTRCMNCNGPIERVSKDSIMDILQANTRKYHDEFFQCRECKKIYWKGSHFDRMQSILATVTH